MSVPAYLNSSYRYLERKGVSDVQTIMDDFASEVLANSPVWTSGGGRYTSPVDGAGRFFDVLFTRATQQKLEMTVRDQNAATIAVRRINCPSGNAWTVRIFTGQFHFVIDVEVVSAAPEHLLGGILDLSPEAQNAHTHYVYAGGSRSSADAAGSADLTYAAMIDNIAAVLGQRCVTWGLRSGGGNGCLFTLGGSRIHRPRQMYCTPTGGAGFYYAGQVYQSLLVPKPNLGFYTELVIPIDPANSTVTGTFKVCGVTPGTYGYRSLAVRIA